MIYIDSRKKSEKTISELYPNAKILDVTSKAKDSLVKLSPFYPHGNIPVPFTEGAISQSVEGIWQGLKVFEGADVDISAFENTKMKNIKRTVRKFGKPLGHRKGIYGDELLGYIEARIEIYLPSYLWVLEHRVVNIINRLKEVSVDQDIVLLDYETNCDILNYKKPISHAYLIKSYVEGDFPRPKALYSQIGLPGNDVKEKPPFVQKKERKIATKKIDPNQNQLF